MELIDGVSLQDKLDKAGPLTLKEILRIGTQMAEGLAAAHKQGLVHRDIKPSNILLENGVERVKITDFGLARAVDDASVTQSGVIAGTPMYMSPEQAEGLALDHRSDLFSLGTVLYVMCTGRPPFRASGTMAVLKRVVEEKARPVREINPEIPEWLEGIIDKLHAKKPADRFQTASEVADLLGQRLADVQAGRALDWRADNDWRVGSVSDRSSPAAGAAPTSARRGSPDPADLSDRSSPIPAGDAGDLRSGVSAGSGHPRRASEDRPPAFPPAVRYPFFLLVLGVLLAVLQGVGATSAEKARTGILTVLGFATIYLFGLYAVALWQARRDKSWHDTVLGRSPWGVTLLLFAAFGVDTLLLATRDGDFTQFLPIWLRDRSRENQRAAIGVLSLRLSDMAIQYRVDGHGANQTGVGVIQLPMDPGHHRVWFSLGDRQFETVPFTVVAGKTSELSLDVKGDAGIAILDGRPLGVNQVGAKPDWVQLFNGKDLTGWRPHPDLPGNWEVERGVLIGRGPQPGYLLSNDDFADFHLRAEVQISENADTGIFFRCSKDLIAKRFPAGYEANLSRDKLGKSWSLYQTVPGQDRALGLARMPEGLIRPETWVRQEVIARGNRIIVKIDAQNVADFYTDNPLRRGLLALQFFAPGSVVRYRTIEIKELPPESATPPLAVAPFDDKKAKEHQAAWARHLGVPVEIENSIGMKLRLIPPGEFTMGTGAKEIDWLITHAPDFKDNEDWLKAYVRNEGPEWRVTIREPYRLGEHEVTVGQFRQFVNATKYRTEAEKNGGGFLWNNLLKKWERHPDNVWSNPMLSGSDAHPVVFVTVGDARAFCAWLSDTEGLRHVLPTDEQWEYACRAGTSTRWFFGDDDAAMAKHGWTVPHSGGRHHPVGRLTANPFGLFDMHGNAAELTVTAQGRAAERGGQANESPQRARSAWRVPVDKTQESHARRGFRVAIVGDLKATSSRKDNLTLVHRFEGHRIPGTGMPLSLSRDGRYLLSGGDRNGILWDMTTRKKVVTLPSESDVTNAAISPDGTIGAISEYQGSVLLWDLPGGKLRATLPTKLDNVVRLQFSPDGRRLVAAGLKAIEVWDVAGARPLHHYSAKGYFTAVAFVPSGTDVLLGGAGADTLLYDTLVGKVVRAFPEVGSSAEHAVSADGRLAAATHLDSIIVWELASGAVRARLTTEAERLGGIAFLKNQNFLAVGDHEGTIRILEWRTGKEVTRKSGLPFVSCRVLPLPDGMHMLCFGGWHRGKTAHQFKEELAIHQWRLPDTVRPQLSPKEPDSAVAPFIEKKAKEHQAAWARHLGVPVEIENSIGMKLRLIPPGEFLMGSTPAEVEAYLKDVPQFVQPWIRSEAPQRKTRIAESFYLATCETTIGHFKQFVQKMSYKTQDEASGKGGTAYGKQLPEYTWRHPAVSISDQHPVCQIALKDAEEFCRWLSKKDGHQYVIPTEEQWEFACRAGTITPWSCPKEELSRFAWVDAVTPKPVRQKLANPFGLFDMHGNAEELTRSHPFSVARGGVGAASSIRSAYRVPQQRSESYRTHGFRVAIVGDLKAKTPAPAVAPFDAAKAKQHQDAWARHLGVDVEIKNSIGMQLRLIPPGEYDLGAGDKDSDARPEEKPRHRVVIRNPFYLGATEVTRSQYQAVMNQGGKFDPKPILDHPAVAVSWHEAMRFCKLLSELEEEKKAGRVYRLPAEVEWEYACRAGSQTPLYFGDIGKIAEHAWFADNGGGFTNPVGKLKPNPWGLHDMLGNVEEWCADTFQGYKAGKIEHDPSIPLPFGTGTNKVARSGSYLTPAKRMTATARTQINPMFATPSLGLRVVLISNRISNSPGR